MTETFVPSGQPVRRFVTAIGLIALLVAISWLLQIGAPRIEATGSAVVMSNLPASGEVSVDVKNEGPLPVKIVAARPHGDRGPDVRLASDVSVRGRGHRHVQITFRFGCRSNAGFDPAVGLERWRTVYTSLMGPECPA